MTSDKLWLFAWAAASGPVPSMRAPTKSASGAAVMKQGFHLLPAPPCTSISLALRRVIAQEDPGTNVEAARGEVVALRRRSDPDSGLRSVVRRCTLSCDADGASSPRSQRCASWRQRLERWVGCRSAGSRWRDGSDGRRWAVDGGIESNAGGDFFRA